MTERRTSIALHFPSSSWHQEINGMHEIAYNEWPDMMYNFRAKSLLSFQQRALTIPHFPLIRSLNPINAAGRQKIKTDLTIMLIITIHTLTARDSQPRIVHKYAFSRKTVSFGWFEN